MLIGIVGYGYSGSGAVLDFLREIKICSYPMEDFEFVLPYLPHGIQDLEYQLLDRKTRYLSSDAAIKDFIKIVCAMDNPRGIYRRITGKAFRKRSYSFVNEITQVSWRGFGVTERYSERYLYRFIRGRKHQLMKIYEQITNKRWTFSKRDMMYLSVMPEKFFENTKKYLQDVLEMLGCDFSRPVILNQPFDAYDPRRSMKFFDKPKAIIVDRDPRDIYILAKCYLKRKGSFIPTDNVDDFIKYHRLVRNPNLSEGQDILFIRYEDMIYEYEQTTMQLLNFLGLLNTRREEKKYFDPSVSIDNTQLFLNHPEFKKDISRIEKELPEYLYPFEKYLDKPQHYQTPF